MNNLAIINELIQLFEQIQIKVQDQIMPLISQIEPLTPLQVKALMFLYNLESIKMTDFAKAMNLKTSGATQLVNNLVELGKVQRDFDPKDRRVIVIELTSSSRQSMMKIIKKRDETLTKIYEKLNQKELESLLNITQKISL